MNLSSEKMGEHGLRGLGFIGPVPGPVPGFAFKALPAVPAPTRPFWQVEGMPDAFTPADAVNLGKQPSRPGQMFTGANSAFKGWSVDAMAAVYLFARRAFVDGTRGNHNPEPVPIMDALPAFRFTGGPMTGMG
ncbi:MAG TPA: hypothetical protein VIY48_00230, partial [Candidatus Paceibacterota bacterium]